MGVYIHTILNNILKSYYRILLSGGRIVDNFKLFKNISDEEMLEMYKDILGSKEMGVRPRSLDQCARKLKETCGFEMLSQATNFVIEIFYEEVAMRYFRKING